MNQKVESSFFIDDNGNPAGGTTKGLGIDIFWQNGPLGRGDQRKAPNGAFVEGVIEAAIQRIQFYQNSKFACDENARALEHLLSAKSVLNLRTLEREARNVEGTHES